MNIHFVTVRWIRWMSEIMVEGIVSGLKDVDGLHSHPLTTQPGSETLDRRKPEISDFTNTVEKYPNSIFVVFGGDGTREFCRALAIRGLRIICIESTHDYSVSIHPSQKQGYECAIDAMIKTAKAFFKDGKQGLLIVAGRNRIGLGKWTKDGLQDLNIEPSIVFATTLAEIRENLDNGYSVVCSEVIGRELGADMDQSITSFPLVEKLREIGVLRLPEEQVLRVTGPDLEKLHYRPSENELALANFAVDGSLEVLRHQLNLGAEDLPGEFVWRYGETGTIWYLSDHAINRRNQELFGPSKLAL